MRVNMGMKICCLLQKLILLNRPRALAEEDGASREGSEATNMLSGSISS
jgi:hypothetical protein